MKVTMLKNNYKWNPLLRLERNELCICGSTKKFKECCLDIMPHVLPDYVVDKMKGYETKDQFNILKVFLHLFRKSEKSKILILRYNIHLFFEKINFYIDSFATFLFKERA